jgi:pSer/pThr/pTyr-binding forkhead associated (FHA) protein
VASGGAPTGKWETLPAHLHQSAKAADILRMEAKLLVRRPGMSEVEIPVDKSEIVIGRLPNEVDLVLDDELVSRKHARLTVNQQGYVRLEDLGSQNGINFKGRLVRRLNLMDGDVFGIGKVEITFRAKLDRFSAEPPKPAQRSDSEDEPPIPEPRAQSEGGGDLEPPRPGAGKKRE